MNHVRFISLDASRADPARRTVPVTVSTEYPVNRGGYQEVLLHGPENVDLSRSPLPLIESHDSSRLNIGSVEGLQVSGRKLRGVARFGTSNRANEIWNDVRDGIVRSVSVAYSIDDHEQEGDTLRATRWTPHEVSLVAVPADPNAGLNRAHPHSTFTGTDMETNQGQPAPNAGNSGAGTQGATAAERIRVTNILGGVEALKEFRGARELGNKAIEEGWSMERFQGEAVNLMASKPGERTLVDIRDRGGDSQNGKRQYSIVRALQSMIDPGSVDASYEREVSKKIERSMGRKPQGMYFPTGELNKRDLTVSGAPSLVGTEHLASAFIDALRARSVIMQLGPMLLPGLTADISVPRLTTASAAYWIAGDGSDSLTPSAPAFDSVTLSPKTVGALVKLSRKMILQGEPAAEDIVRADLAKVIATALDKAAIQGSGASNQPTGIVSTSGISTDTFGAATPTFAEIVAMESALLADNVDASKAVYLMAPALAGTLKTTQKATYGDEMLWEASADPGVGVVNGLRAVASSNVPAGKVILANLSDLIMGFWGGVDITVNPYEDYAAGTVSVRAFASVDISVRHPESFAVYSTP